MAQVFGPSPFGQSDFLIVFEQLCILIPAVTILCSVPLYRAKAKETTFRAQITLSLKLKLAIVSVLAAIQLELIRQSWQHLSQLKLMRIAALAACLSPLGMACIIYVEDRCTVKTAPFITVFMTFTTIIDLFVSRTYFSYDQPNYAMVVLKLALFCLEQVPKQPRQLPNVDEPTSDPGNVSQLWNIALFKWAMHFLGFQKNIANENITFIDEELDAEKLSQRFTLHWKEGTMSFLQGFLCSLSPPRNCPI